MNPPAGFYLHWPYCERKCPYCDFYTFGREHPAQATHGHYLDALIEEIGSAPARLGLRQPPPVDAVYFGGGTPSLMGPEALARVLEALRAIAALEAGNVECDGSPPLEESAGRPAHATSGIEITLEVNPTTAEAAGIAQMLALGVNRLSVGCQSFNDRLLEQLGRVHDAATTRRAIGHMRAAGARNLSLDIIFGVPTQSIDDLERDIDELLSFAPEHLSAYGLTLHEGTPYHRWAREGRIRPPDDDAQATMFERLIERFGAAGYEHYEISNWARAGLASRHNSKYWRRCDVFGFGVSAHSVIGGRRVENPRALDEYLNVSSRRLAVALDPPRDERARCGEIMMLALRRVAGAAWSELDDWLGVDARAMYAREFDALGTEDLLTLDAAGLRLTRRGLLLADSVFERFF
jgi:oxygen-independent coproporphyrinogen-3 oxidase